jgi:predicted TIM-barrel fold metal-dependent hydrolase
MREYRLIDADTHVLEPGDMWQKYIDPAYREQAPFVFVDSDGKERISIQGVVYGGPEGLGHLGAFGAAWGHGSLDVPYSACREGNHSKSRIQYMDREGIDATVLYPSLGLALGGLEPTFAAACYRAYNRWLADFCRPYPDRLFGAAMLPLQSVEHAVAEARYARKELGMRAVFVRPNPYAGRMLHHPDYDPLWAEIQELDLAVSVHSGSASDMPTVAVERFEGPNSPRLMARHIVAHAMEEMLAAVSLIFCGVCDRFPRIRFGFFEGGGGWMAAWLDRMDRHYFKAFSDAKLSMKPSELFQRQCWVTFDVAEGSLPFIAEYLGNHKILFATDFPHPDGAPGGADTIRRLERLSTETKRKILSSNALDYYKIG